jgi:hypothetical protein
MGSLADGTLLPALIPLLGSAVAGDGLWSTFLGSLGAITK